MKKVAIMTDSNSGLTQEKAKEMGVSVLPMPFYINGELFFENITLTQEEFYEKLSEDAEISTSQPSPGQVTDMWDELLKEYDEIVHIPMSSGLSSSCETAMMLAQDYDGRVQVVDNHRISVILIDAINDAINLVKAGKDAKEIKEILEEESYNACAYITLETLKYLKKGGRITPAAAAIGTVLNLKPVLQIQGGKLDAYAKVRGTKAAKKAMIAAIQKEIEQKYGKYAETSGLTFAIAYTYDIDKANEWKEEFLEVFPGVDIHMEPLSLSVACHIGPGAIACTISKKADVQ